MEKSQTIKLHCSHCNSEVKRTQYTKNRDGSSCDKIFCNKECYLNYKAEIRNADSKPCPNCNKIFFITGGRTKAKFCNEECRIEFGYKQVVAKHAVKGVTDDGKRYIKECQVCGNDFEVRKQKALKKVCSQACLSEFYKTDEARKAKISKSCSGENHPNYVNGCSNNYRLRKTEIKEYFFKKEKDSVMELFDNKCFNCGSMEDLTIDHHIPFSKGGLLTLGNAVLLCRSCNSSKNAKLPEDFYNARQLKQLEKLGITKSNLFNFIA